MDLRRIPPSVQRRWADEVLYLHSLWHQSPTPLSNPNSSPNSKKRTRSDKEWPTPAPTPAAPAPLTAWPDPVRPPHPRPPPSTTARALHVQYPALQSTRDYFSSQESDDEDEEEEDDEEAKAYEFFLGVFVGDGELRGYYENSYEKGEFLCLVCGGVEAKVGRKYGGCVALVQHACSIAKRTKRGKAHRGFGRAVCRVLGWDATRLPSIVLDVEKPLGQTIVNGMQMQECGVNDEKDEVLEGSRQKIHQILGPRVSGHTSTLPKVLSSSEKQARYISSRVHRNGLKATEAIL